MHYIRMSERIINLSINDTNLSATYANIHLKIIVVRLVTQQATVDGERGNIALIIIDNDEALAWHCDVFGRQELFGCVKWTKQITERGVNENWAIWMHKLN